MFCANLITSIVSVTVPIWFNWYWEEPSRADADEPTLTPNVLTFDPVTGAPMNAGAVKEVLIGGT